MLRYLIHQLSFVLPSNIHEGVSLCGLLWLLLVVFLELRCWFILEILIEVWVRSQTSSCIVILFTSVIPRRVLFVLEQLLLSCVHIVDLLK